MTSRPSPRRRPPESEVVALAARFLERSGYRVRINPDGTDYFDLVARRGDEVGLVEAKVGDARTVLRQALRRRGWSDWGAVILASERSAERLAHRTIGTRAGAVGVWAAADGEVRVLRAARPWVRAGLEDPFADLRARFRRLLDALDDGSLPSALRWDGVPGEVRRVSGGRRFAEWRLDEEPDPPR